MTTTKILSTSLLALAVPAAFAQTSTAKPAVHTAAAHMARPAACVTMPPLNSKIPAVPAGTPCPKILYTITRHPDIVFDYKSPEVSPAVAETLNAVPTSISLVYQDLKIGTGEKALPHKWYTVHYTGYLPDGSKFDSSVDRGEPISFPYGGHHVIPGWDTGFEGMRMGGKRRLFVPYQLAYGEQGRPPAIPPHSELIFDVELISQSDNEPPKPVKPATKMPAPPATTPGAPAKPATPPPAGAAPATGATK